MSVVSVFCLCLTLTTSRSLFTQMSWLCFLVYKTELVLLFLSLSRSLTSIWRISVARYPSCSASLWPLQPRQGKGGSVSTVSTPAPTAGRRAAVWRGNCPLPHRRRIYSLPGDLYVLLMLLGLALEPCVMTAVLGPSLSAMKIGPCRRFVDVQHETSLVWLGVVPDNPRELLLPLSWVGEKRLFSSVDGRVMGMNPHQLFASAYFSELFFLAMGWETKL